MSLSLVEPTTGGRRPLADGNNGLMLSVQRLANNDLDVIFGTRIAPTSILRHHGEWHSVDTVVLIGGCGAEEASGSVCLCGTSSREVQHSGSTVVAQWQHSSGTCSTQAAQWQHSSGTVVAHAAQWQHRSNTGGNIGGNTVIDPARGDMSWREVWLACGNQPLRIHDAMGSMHTCIAGACLTGWLADWLTG